MDNQKDNWRRCVEFHGHECPGLAIGYRACEAAVEQLGVSFSRDEEVVCVTENDACGVDAIQVLTGCSIGKGNLIYRPTGKMAFSFFCRQKESAVRLVFQKTLGGEGLDRQAMQQMILTAPLAELFAVKQPAYQPPEKARLFNSVTCEQCGENCIEHAARLQQGKIVCLDCVAQYSRGW
jgi:formylmethanofuran dehydrogenase subunit E